jgi:hypothetical protein
MPWFPDFDCVRHDPDGLLAAARVHDDIEAPGTHAER